MASMWSIQNSSTTRSVTTRSTSRMTGEVNCSSFFAYARCMSERIFSSVSSRVSVCSSASEMSQVPAGKKMGSKCVIISKKCCLSASFGSSPKALAT